MLLNVFLNNSVDTNIWSRCSFSTCFIFFKKQKNPTLWIRCCIIWWWRRPFRWIIGKFIFSRLRACKSASYINVQQKKWCPFGSLPFANFLDLPRDGEPGSFWCYTLLNSHPLGFGPSFFGSHHFVLEHFRPLIHSDAV